MVAYSFQARFCEPIIAGTKGGTIRNDRKRHARQGEELQLYYAMRTKHCRLLKRPTCLDVRPITLDFAGGRIILDQKPMWALPKSLDAFAIFDGFQSWERMLEFWVTTHSTAMASYMVFSGIHIRWAPWPKELAT